MENGQYFISSNVTNGSKRQKFLFGRQCGCSLIIFIVIIVVVTLFSISREDVIHIDYHPNKYVKLITDAEKFTISVAVNDLRQDKIKIGCNNKILGIRFGAIKSIEDVPIILKKAVEIEILNRGFSISNNSNTLINIDLNKFYNDFKKGYLHGDTVAELSMKIMVKYRANNHIIYTKQINVQENMEISPLKTIFNIKYYAKLGLENSLTNAMQQLFADFNFIKSLQKAK